jgi:hypothetical protein
MDDRDAAETALRDALQMAEEIGYPPVTWRAHSLLGEIARRRGHLGEAQRLAGAARRRVVDLSRALDDPDAAREFRAMGDALASDPLGAYR